MSKKVVIGLLVLAGGGAVTAAPADAGATREFLNSFAINGEPSGLAVDLETGNVYAFDKETSSIEIFGPTGGAPVDGVPARIESLTPFETGGLRNPVGVAVDNSCYEHRPRLTGVACEEYDPAYGDVYIQGSYRFHGIVGLQRFKLNAADEYEFEPLTELPFHYSLGVTVDSGGNIFVTEGASESRVMLEYKKLLKKETIEGREETKEALEEIAIPQALISYPAYVAADDAGNLYVSNSREPGGPSEGYNGVARLKIDGAGNVASDEIFTGNVLGARRPVAVDHASGTVYIGDGAEIAEYDSAGDLQLKFGSTEPSGGSLGDSSSNVSASGIAINSETERIYVANPLHQDVDVFGPVIGPPVVEAQQPAASSVERTSALIAGAVDPDSGQGATFFFEYIEGGEYDPGSANPYHTGARSAQAEVAGAHAVETTPGVSLVGLKPETTYHYRLVVSNASGTSYGPDETFTTAAPTPPVATTGAANDVTATSVTLSGVVAPHGLPTSYVFEVGADAAYKGARLFGSAGDVGGEVAVSVGLQYLVPGETYHYRLVASSFDGVSYGQDQTFTTAAVSSAIERPQSAPLLASPGVQFPSIAGAITHPVGVTKVAKKPKKRAHRGRARHRRKSKRSRRRSH